ncbi:hypothetical protein AVEN_205832-1 [Araneus ventricosus]|uniref:Uncharacterized protein n=1 Tax=Araneus ventricosus TaxID=182803 RepID=A0A4Y2HDV5_ARAVE|nr:hypothetical protein AVEN_205832-1 [Araneus ventricosus]
MIRNDGIQTNSKSETSCVNSNLRPRCEASGTSNDLPRLGPRNEARKVRRVGREEWGDRRTADFGAYVNDIRNFSIKMCGKQWFRTNGMASLQLNIQLKKTCCSIAYAITLPRGYDIK